MALLKRGVSQFCTDCGTRSFPDGAEVCPHCKGKVVNEVKPKKAEGKGK